jgi:hypothetical protein
LRACVLQPNSFQDSTNEMTQLQQERLKNLSKTQPHFLCVFAPLREINNACHKPLRKLKNLSKTPQNPTPRANY